MATLAHVAFARPYDPSAMDGRRDRREGPPQPFDASAGAAYAALSPARFATVVVPLAAVHALGAVGAARYRADVLAVYETLLATCAVLLLPLAPSALYAARFLLDLAMWYASYSLRQEVVPHFMPFRPQV